MAPWTIRNLIVFGRLIPVKSNAAYELYQSQCLQPDGLLQARAFSTHPYSYAGPERQEYKASARWRFSTTSARAVLGGVLGRSRGLCRSGRESLPGDAPLVRTLQP